VGEAMSNLRSIKARIGSARLLIADHAASPSVGRLSEIQAAAIVTMINEAVDLGDADKADLVTAALAVKFTDPRHLDMVIDACSPRHVALPVGKKRRTLQDYAALTSYGTPSLWGAVEGVGLPTGCETHEHHLAGRTARAPVPE